MRDEGEERLGGMYGLFADILWFTGNGNCRVDGCLRMYNVCSYT